MEEKGENSVNIDKKPVEEDTASDQEEWIGPTPAEATETGEPQTKKRKVLQYEKLFIDK